MSRPKVVIFRNWTKKDFTHIWNGVPYSFKVGEEMYLELPLAEHFACHLIDRELNDKKLPTNHFSRQELIDKCLVTPDEKIGDAEALEHADPDRLRTIRLNANNGFSPENAEQEKSKTSEKAKDTVQETGKQETKSTDDEKEFEEAQ